MDPAGSTWKGCDASVEGGKTAADAGFVAASLSAGMKDASAPSADA